MIDDFFMSIHDELQDKWGRTPTFEEVREYIDGMFVISKEEEREINMRKVYGK